MCVFLATFLWKPIEPVMKRLIWSLPLLLLIAACQSTQTPASTESLLIGRWDMAQVYDGGEDVTAEHNPAGNRWVAFASEGTFISDGDPYGRNAGRWTYDPATQELYLDSDAGEGDDSYWIVQVEGDEMHWQGARSAFTKRFEIVHVKH